MIEMLSLGAGVQSSTVLLMSIRGELPKLDHAIFADTGWEPAAVYRQMDWLECVATNAGITVHRVRRSNIRADGLRAQVRGRIADGGMWTSIPYFVLGPTGDRGQLKRQCTSNYKIYPIEQCLRRKVLGLQPRQRAPKVPVIRHWFGISHDERQRMRISQQPWQTFWYPLVERRMTRHLCLEWMRDHEYREPPRSACIGCPYRSNREWRKLRDESPTEWQDAIAFDEAIRHCGGVRGELFLHAARMPLKDVDLSTDWDRGQLPLFDGMVDECSGMCGV